MCIVWRLMKSALCCCGYDLEVEDIVFKDPSSIELTMSNPSSPLTEKTIDIVRVNTDNEGYEQDEELQHGTHNTSHSETNKETTQKRSVQDPTPGVASIIKASSATAKRSCFQDQKNDVQSCPMHDSELSSPPSAQETYTPDYGGPSKIDIKSIRPGEFKRGKQWVLAKSQKMSYKLELNPNAQNHLFSETELQFGREDSGNQCSTVNTTSSNKTLKRKPLKRRPRMLTNAEPKRRERLKRWNAIDLGSVDEEADASNKKEEESYYSNVSYVTPEQKYGPPSVLMADAAYMQTCAINPVYASGVTSNIGEKMYAADSHFERNHIHTQSGIPNKGFVNDGNRSSPQGAFVGSLSQSSADSNISLAGSGSSYSRRYREWTSESLTSSDGYFPTSTDTNTSATASGSSSVYFSFDYAPSSSESRSICSDRTTASEIENSFNDFNILAAYNRDSASLQTDEEQWPFNATSNENIFEGGESHLNNIRTPH